MEAETAPRAATALPVRGDEIDRYRVLGQVATGGMAAVFAARRSSLGGFERLLALKVMLPHLADERYFVDMFLDEARIASQVHHANVIQVFDVVEHHGLPCIVMEFLHGHSFAAVLQMDLSIGLRLFVLAGVAKGLVAAHETLDSDGEPLRIVHRDVSPDNVHVGYDGQVKVVDFGIAAARGKLSKTRSGELKGKLAYLSPEQLTASPNVDGAADVWSLGVVAWEALTGKRLFADDSDAATMWNVVHRPVVDLREHLPELDDDVATTIADCLRRGVNDRISGQRAALVFAEAAARMGATANALAQHMAATFSEQKSKAEADLDRTVSGAAVLRPHAPTASTSHGVSGRHRWPLLVAAGLTGLLGLAAVYAWPQQGADSAPPRASDAAVQPPPPAQPDRKPEPGHGPGPQIRPAPEETNVSQPTPSADPPDAQPDEPRATAAVPARKAQRRPARARKRKRGPPRAAKTRTRAEGGGSLMDSPY